MYAKFQVGPAPRQGVRGKTFVIYMFDDALKSRGFPSLFLTASTMYKWT